jgi:predicted transcriptional regulator
MFMNLQRYGFFGFEMYDDRGKHIKKSCIFAAIKGYNIMDNVASFQKLDLIHWITELNDLSILAQVNAIKENNVVESYAELQSIERGLDDIQQGRVISHAQVKKRYEKWL